MFTFKQYFVQTASQRTFDSVCKYLQNGLILTENVSLQGLKGVGLKTQAELKRLQEQYKERYQQ
jgi:hypothetical protein